MRVFVTGASGWVGRGLVPELLAAGHTVTGLARSDAAAEALRAAGVQPRPGSLDDLDTLREAAADSDGVVHLAFKHDIAFSGDFAGATEADRLAIATLGGALAGSDRPFVIASGILGVVETAPGALATERDGLPEAPDSTADVTAAGDAQTPIAGAGSRVANAHFTLALAERGVRSSVVRLPPTTHGDGDNGFIPTAIGFARQKGAAAYVGDGANRWSGVHRLDAAHLYRLALEGAPAGSRLHASDEEGVPFREIAEVIGRHLGLPAVSVAHDEAQAHFGWFTHFAEVDNPISSALTRKELGWSPVRPGLIADLEEGHYFQQ